MRRRSGCSSNAFLPVPRITGKTIRLIWSTRSLSMSAWTSLWLPGTCSSPSNSPLSLRTSSVASPLSRTVVFVPLRVFERRRDDELRHRVELVGERALALRPSPSEALIGPPAYEQPVGLHRLVQLEL